MLELRFETTIIEWRGPAPFAFAPVPPEHIGAIAAAGRSVSYGWGMIPVAARLGDVTFTTALFPKNSGYLLPLKDNVRRQASVTFGDTIAILLVIAPQH